jgi:hypothetical protein
LYGEVSRTWSGIGDRVFSALNNGGVLNTFELYTDLNNSFRLYLAANNVLQASPIVASAFAANTPMKAIAAYQINNVNAAAGGTLGVLDSSAIIPVVDRLSIGSRANALIWNGCIKKLAYYPKRLQNEELVGLTTV